MSLRIAILAVLILSGQTLRAESTQCTPINSAPATLSAPGSYCLINDLTSTATGTAAAITIAADDVVLDLNGHSVSGPGGSNAGIGIYSISHRSLRVRNGVVRGFSYGVQLTDTYSYFPPFVGYNGFSTRHDVGGLRIENSTVGIFVVGPYSKIHDNQVLDSTQYGIQTAAITGPYAITGNEVINTRAVSGATTAVYGIHANGVGTVVQDNLVQTVRGPGASGAIFASVSYANGSSMILSRNRETDLDTGWAIVCATVSGAYPARVENNIANLTPGNKGLSGCVQLGDNY